MTICTLITTILVSSRVYSNNLCLSYFEPKQSKILLSKFGVLADIAPSTRLSWEDIEIIFSDHFSKNRLVNAEGKTRVVKEDGQIINLDLLIKEGGHNRGVFEVNYEGNPRIIKVVNLDIIQSMRELYFLSRAIEVGGPKLYGFGITKLQGKKLLFVEMEDLFHGQDKISLRRLSFLKKLKNKGEFYNKYVNSEFLKKLSLSLANLLFRTLEKKMNPGDPDLIVSEFGELKWVDFGSWSKVRDVREATINMYFVANYLEAISPRDHKEMLKILFHKIDNSTILSATEKQNFKKSYIEL